MKQIQLICLFLMISMGILSQTGDANFMGIKFEKGSWKEVVQKAKTENKLIFIDCYTESCGPCKVMDRNVFPDKSVGDYYNSNFINVKMDMMKGDGIAIGKQFEVKFFPTLLFIDGDEKEIHRSVGGYNVENFIALGNEVFSDNNLSSLNDKYNSGIREPDFLKKYCNLLYTSRNNAKLKIYLADYFKTIPNKELTKEINWHFINMYVEDAMSREFQYLYYNRDKFVALHSEKDVDGKIDSVVRWGAYKYIRENGDKKTIDQDGFDQFKKWFRSMDFENQESIILSAESANAITTKDFLKYIEIMDKGMETELLPSAAPHVYQYVARCISSTNPIVLKKADSWLDQALTDIGDDKRWEGNLNKLKGIIANKMKEI